MNIIKTIWKQCKRNKNTGVSNEKAKLESILNDCSIRKKCRANTNQNYCTMFLNIEINGDKHVGCSS